MRDIRSHSVNRTVRFWALASVSGAALTLALPALAQTPAPQAAQAPAVEEIIVTGTRVVRDGYEAPTPLTVVGIEQIQSSAPENIADFVNKLPSVVGSATPQNSNTSISSGSAGVNSLNLRGLGTVRTLVLLDGQRSVGSQITGVVDVNEFPQGLISRVDVVTGGASAAYGSDALSGVVNFVLDKKFTGLKGEVSGGVTTYGDGRSWKVALTGGLPFAGDRGHLLISGELSDRDGIIGVPRAWNNNGWFIMVNPNYTATNGQPQQLVLNNVGLSTASKGGIITNTGLRGIAFGPGGTPYQFNYGSLTSDPWTQGGDWRSTQVNDVPTLDPSVYRQGVFTRGSYQITDDIEVFAQLSWGHTRTFNICCDQFNVANYVVKTDNAFIPASVAAQAAALKLTQFTLGSMNADLPVIGAANNRYVTRYVVGANGKFDAFDNAWTWDAYYQKGISRLSNRATNVTSKVNLAQAIDAVRAPNGTIVCRSTLTAPNNGCVPYNIMGQGVNSAATIAYLEGAALQQQTFRQDVFAATLNGEPFSTWAGPVSLATGIEHRKEATKGDADPTSKINGWFAGNYLPTNGSYTVTEGFVETVLPLARDAVWAKSLDLNAAARFTGYSVSGFVTTWKVGATWDVIPDIRLRATRSRDIRAPNLNDLFAAGTANTNNVIDRFNNNTATQYQGLQVGNRALVPEKADTTGVGVVLQPQFFPGFSASFDYYNIEIGNAIGNVQAQQIVDLCFAGNQAFCAAITRGTGVGGTNVITQIRITPFNLVNQIARGYDIEASYTTHLGDIVDSWGGDLSLRVLATHYLKNFSNNGVNAPTDTVGQNSGNGPPNWIYHSTLTYSNEPITASLTMRGVSSGRYSNGNYNYIQCTSGCPTSTVTATTINFDHIDAATYFDASVTYRLGDRDKNTEVFLAVQNLTNKDPAIVAQGPSGVAYATPPANSTLYDILGRVFRAGVRFKM